MGMLCAAPPSRRHPPSPAPLACCILLTSRPELFGGAWLAIVEVMQSVCSSFAGLALRPAPAARASSGSARRQLVVQAAVQAAPVELPVRKLDGSEAGSSSIALKVADPEVSNGLVHR